MKLNEYVGNFHTLKWSDTISAEKEWNKAIKEIKKNLKNPQLYEELIDTINFLGIPLRILYNTESNKFGASCTTFNPEATRGPYDTKSVINIHPDIWAENWKEALEKCLKSKYFKEAEKNAKSKWLSK